MPWVLPPTAVTGNVIPASFGNDVIGNFTILETAIGLLGGNTAIAGSPPAATSPAFYVNAGVTGFTAASAASRSRTPSPMACSRVASNGVCSSEGFEKPGEL